MKDSYNQFKKKKRLKEGLEDKIKSDEQEKKNNEILNTKNLEDHNKKQLIRRKTMNEEKSLKTTAKIIVSYNNKTYTFPKNHFLSIKEETILNPQLKERYLAQQILVKEAKPSAEVKQEANND